MARKKKTKSIPFALAASVAAHASLVLILIYNLRSPVASRHGVIAVEFIEPVRHEVKGPRFRDRSAPKAGSVRPDPAPEAVPPVAQGMAGDPEVRARETDTYIRAALEMINRKKTYPRDSIERGEEGRVVLGVSLDRNGRVIEAHVEESSRVTRLDAAALKIISEISAFPPLPETIETPLHLHIPIVYRLESRP